MQNILLEHIQPNKMISSWYCYFLHFTKLSKILDSSFLTLSGIFVSLREGWGEVKSYSGV